MAVGVFPLRLSPSMGQCYALLSPDAGIEGPIKSKHRERRDMVSVSVWSTPQVAVTVPAERATRREGYDAQTLGVSRHAYDRWSLGQLLWWRRPWRWSPSERRLCAGG